MDTKLVYEKLQPVIAAMNKSITAQSMVDNGDGSYTFTVSKTKWAIEKWPVSILGNDYTISEVIYNTSITVKGSVVPVVLTFDLYPFIFKYGTIKMVASELNNLPLKGQRLPLVWLREITTERIHFDDLDAIGNEADVNIFFVTDRKDDWSQGQGDTKAVAPMRSALNEFLKALSVSQYVGRMDNTGEVKSYNNFGMVDGKNVFNEPLAGVGLRVTVPFLKECDCCENETLDTRPAPGYVTDINGNIIAILYSNEYYVVTGGGVGVTITDQDGNILTTVADGGNYPVTVLTEIKDTIDGNNVTIIDNIN